MQIRSAQTGDLPALARLMAQLGYAIATGELRSTLAALECSPRDKVLVAECGQALAGCICLHVMPVLQSVHPVGRISALVIDEAWRGQGIGQAMLTRAEQYFQQQGCRVIEVTSAAHRTAAHGFYLARGYRELPCRFVRVLGARDPS